jgi:glycosyltransferase 2 family protein
MRAAVLLILRILVSGGLFYLAVRAIQFDAIRERLGSLRWGWFAAAVFTTFLQVVLSALRWREVTERCGAPLTDREAFRFNMIGTFFNQTLPSTIGGDAMRLWLLGNTGAGWRAATYSVLVDRAIGFIALALIIVGSLPWSYPLITNPHGRLALLLVDFVAVGSSAGFLVLGALSWHWLKRWWPIRHIHACGEIANQVLFDRRAGPKIAALSFAIHVLTVVATWCAVYAIQATASFGQLFLLIPPIILITMLPVSIAGWGVREATMMVAFGYAGLAKIDGTVVSIIFGAATFAVGVLGGLVWITSSEKPAKSSALIPNID